MMTEPQIVTDKRRALAYLREARKFMPYLHESMPAHGVVRLLGDRDRAQRALVALVQDRKIVYLENCSPDHYQAYAAMTPTPLDPAGLASITAQWRSDRDETAEVQ